MTKKLLTCVVGANDVFIYHPEHNKNHYIYHKKKNLKFTQNVPNNGYIKSKFTYINKKSHQARVSIDIT
jgi:phage antirepressor YoqD-like protein